MYLKHKPDVILLDLKIPKLDGSNVLDAFVRNNMDTQVIATSAYVND